MTNRNIDAGPIVSKDSPHSNFQIENQFETPKQMDRWINLWNSEVARRLYAIDEELSSLADVDGSLLDIVERYFEEIQQLYRVYHLDYWKTETQLQDESEIFDKYFSQEVQENVQIKVVRKGVINFSIFDSTTGKAIVYEIQANILNALGQVRLHNFNATLPNESKINVFIDAESEQLNGVSEGSIALRSQKETDFGVFKFNIHIFPDFYRRNITAFEKGALRMGASMPDGMLVEAIYSPMSDNGAVTLEKLSVIDSSDTTLNTWWEGSFDQKSGVIRWEDKGVAATWPEKLKRFFLAKAPPVVFVSDTTHNGVSFSWLGHNQQFPIFTSIMDYVPKTVTSSN